MNKMHRSFIWLKSFRTLPLVVTGAALWSFSSISSMDFWGFDWNKVVETAQGVGNTLRDTAQEIENATLDHQAALEQKHQEEWNAKNKRLQMMIQAKELATTEITKLENALTNNTLISLTSPLETYGRQEDWQFENYSKESNFIWGNTTTGMRRVSVPTEMPTPQNHIYSLRNEESVKKRLITLKSFLRPAESYITRLEKEFDDIKEKQKKEKEAAFNEEIENKKLRGDLTRNAVKTTSEAFSNFVTDITNKRKQNEERKHQLNLAKIQGEADVKKGAIQTATVMKYLADPKNLVKWSAASFGTIGIASALYFLSKYGIPLLLKEKPDIVKETNMPQNLLERITGRKKEKSLLSEFRINTNLEEQIKRLFAKTQRAIKEKGKFDNALLYGPPGTGKTMFAVNLARKLGIDYIITSGAAFQKLSKEDALQQLTKLVRYARTSKKGVIVFVDEADSLFKSRKNSLDSHTESLINLFLSLVPEQNDSQIMFIFGTNRPETLDAAVLSRFAKTSWLRFDAPDQKTREELLALYLEKQFKDHTISEEVYKHIPELSKMMEGFVGRDIQGIAKSLYDEMHYQNVEELTYPLTRNHIQEIIENKGKLEAYSY